MIDQENMIETEVGKQTSMETLTPKPEEPKIATKINEDNNNLNDSDKDEVDVISRNVEQSLKVREIQLPFNALEQLSIVNKKHGQWINVQKDKFLNVLLKLEIVSPEIKCLKEELSGMELDDLSLKIGEKSGDNLTVTISIKQELDFLVDGLQLPHQLMEAVVKYPREWKSMGSENEVRLGQVENTRPLIKLEMETHTKNMQRPLQLSERLGDSKESYVAFGPGTRNISTVLREQLDIAVQAVPKVKAAAAQMEPGLPINAWTQYIYDLEGAEEIQKSLSKDLPSNYKFDDEEYLERALEYNETFNLYTNDYPLLVKREEDSVIPLQALFSPMDALIDVRYVAGLVVVMIAWNPMREGELAVLYAPSTNALLHEETHSTANNNKSCVLLIWSLKSPLEPKIILDCPREVVVVRWCPVDENLLVGGCISGQVIIWDLSGKMDASELQPQLSNTRQRARKMLLNTLEWTNLYLGSGTMHVESSALSSLAHSHEGAVTDLQWLTPYYMLDNGGHYKPMVSKRFSLQFISSGKDGALLIWDLRLVPEEASKIEKLQKSKEDSGRYCIYNRIMRPLYKIIPQVPNTKKKFSIVSIAVPNFVVNYEKKYVTQTTESITEEKQNRDWVVLKPSENYECDKSIMPDRSVWLGTDDGILALVRWEGFSFDKGEEVTSELVDVVSACSSIHDGPIVCTLLSPFLPSVLLTIGGHVFALWTQEQPNCPFLIRRATNRLTSAAWSLVRPSLLRVTRIDGTLEVWDFLYRSDRPILEQSLSGEPLTAFSNNPFVLPDGRRVVAVGDYKNALHLLYNPPQFQNCSSSDLNQMKNFVERETELRRRYESWNVKFQSVEKKRENTVSNNLNKTVVSVVRSDILEDKKNPRKRTKKVDEQTTREEQKMLSILMKKKNLNKTELLAKQQPLRLVEQMAEEKRIKNELKIKQQEEEFKKTVSSLLPEIDSIDLKEGPTDEDIRDEVRASLQGVMKSWKEGQKEFLQEFESESPILERQKVLEEGMARRLAVDISLFSCQKRQERFASRQAFWEKNPPLPLDSSGLYVESKKSLAICETLLEGEQQ